MSDVDDRREMQARIEELLQSDRNRTALLVELAPRVPPRFFPVWIQAALRVEEPLQRFLILQALAERASGELREAALSGAMRAAREIHDPEQREAALFALLAAKPGALPVSGFADVLGAMRGVSDPRLGTGPVGRFLETWLVSDLPLRTGADPAETFDRFRAVSRGTSFATPAIARYGVELLRQAGGRLTREQLREALQSTGEIRDEQARAVVLAGIAPLLTPELRMEGLGAARELRRSEPRARALIGFVPALRGTGDLQTEVSREALGLVPAMRHWNAQAAGFRKLNRVIPDPAVEYALDLELGLDRPGVQTRALASLAPRLELEQLDRVAALAGTVPDSWGKVHLLEAARGRARELDPPGARRIEREMGTLLKKTERKSEAEYARFASAGSSKVVPGTRRMELDLLREMALGPVSREIASLVWRDVEGVSELVARSLGGEDRPVPAIGPPPPFIRTPAAVESVTPAEVIPEPQGWPAGPQHVVSTGFSLPDRPAKPHPARRPLRPDTEYLFWLEIGAPVAGAVDENPTELPAELLPPDAVLEVVLVSNDPGLVLVGKQRAEVAFDDGGAIRVRTPAHVPGALAAGDEILARRLFFALRTPGARGEYRLRCGIYFRRVLVQSREVTLRVSIAARGEPALVTRVDYTLSRSLSPAHLSAYQPHQLSVMMNRAGDGSHNFHFVGEGDLAMSARFDPLELQDLLTRLRGGLRQASWGSDGPWDSRVERYRYADPAQFGQLFQDLHTLAQNGYRAYDTIVDRLGGGPEGADLLRERMRRPGLVQLALRDSARMVVPLALLYDFPLDVQLPPGECRLCDHFQRTVGDRTPLHEHDCFTGNCPNYDDDSVVCPGGFWGFRHALGVPVSLVGAGNSPPGVPALLEPAEVVQMVVAVCTDEQLTRRVGHVKALRTLLPGDRFHYAETRTETLEKMRSAEAQVLYFYCHGGVKERTPYIQVGPLSDPGIERSTLRQKKIRWAMPRPRPLVFVNGCHTVDVEPDVAIEMVSGFVQTAGASAVIGTEITVFERLATDFGERFLRTFLLERATLGEAVRRTRLAILQKQLNPLGLAYVPFGLASLRLADPLA